MFLSQSPMCRGDSVSLKSRWRGEDIFAGANVIQVEFVALLGALQVALVGGKEVAGQVKGLVGIAAHLLKLSNWDRAAGRVVAHAHGGVVLIQLSHPTMFAVVVLSRVFSHHLFLSTFINFYFHLDGAGSHEYLRHLTHRFLYNLCLIRQGSLLRGCQDPLVRQRRKKIQAFMVLETFSGRQAAV